MEKPSPEHLKLRLKALAGRDQIWSRADEIFCEIQAASEVWPQLAEALSELHPTSKKFFAVITFAVVATACEISARRATREDAEQYGLENPIS
jgi:hypothetical protein